MALADLLKALREQAAGQRDEVLAAADAEAVRVRAESRAALERRRLEYVERIRREEEEAARRAVSRAEREARASMLSARGRLLARVGGALRARADASVGDPDYLVALPDEVRRALDRLPAGEVVVHAPPALVGIVRDAAGDRAGVVVEAAETGTGFVASVPSAGVEVDGTLRTRIAYAWGPLAVSVLAEMGT